ncbi:GDP-mannose 4,6-dehydratase [Streptosporangium amethystogenes subsp. fukuiense]|uniref:GDP-mannose 4,6-dehydratase n=1 Tax=Streptosporangium amethystogenes subsp. fukuiense TaxID=698418 RepID=A0ABW2SRZ5_9ACTN
MLHIRQGDITDARLPADVVPGHDVIVNFAAETHVDRSISGPGEFVVTNMHGLQRLL